MNSIVLEGSQITAAFNMVLLSNGYKAQSLWGMFIYIITNM